MVIVALNHVPQCFSQADGVKIHDVLVPYLDNAQSITLSFTGVEDVTSSFVNASLVPFVEAHGADHIKSILRIVGATSQVADTIKRCFVNAERVRQFA